jgi:formylglycine-generating enzyme
VACASWFLACARGKDGGPREGGASATVSASPSPSASAFVWPLSAVADGGEKVPPRKGMIWIPAGTLLAGMPKDRTPRIADEELPGEPIELAGFYIDEFAYPNEVGAIPKTGMNRDEAVGLCAGHDKRLCTELEWERACKGPSNTAYEYGETYRAAECLTGQAGRLAPSGLRVACRSAFGVHDMHGGPWEWTASIWRRGPGPRYAVARGGNSDAGELVGRCANAMAVTPSTRRPDIGVRCCAGEANRAEIKLNVVRGKPFEARRYDNAFAASVVQAIRASPPPELAGDIPFRVDRIWNWHPVGNEELLVAAGCVKRSPHSDCGAAILRMRPSGDSGAEGPALVGFASSGWWMSVIKTANMGRDLLVFGGDGNTTFKRRVAYAWGRVAVGETERTRPSDIEE